MSKTQLDAPSPFSDGESVSDSSPVSPVLRECVRESRFDRVGSRTSPRVVSMIATSTNTDVYSDTSAKEKDADDVYVPVPRRSIIKERSKSVGVRLPLAMVTVSMKILYMFFILRVNI